MKLIVGLGNPGRKYVNSRHNVGFRCIDHMARRWGVPLRERRKSAVLGRGDVDGHPVVLAKPRTFMNDSGSGVRYLLTRFASGPRDLVVVYDEMDLPLGKVRVRRSGSAAGHNGIRSIVDAIASQEFARIRVGIGKAPEGVDGMDHVLRSMTAEERKVIECTVETVSEAVACLLGEGIDVAMNRFN